MPPETAPIRKILEWPIPAFIIKEITEALPAIVFFAVGFNLVVLTTQLILDDYAVQFAGFMVATTAALLVGKAVLVAKVLPFFRRFDNAPLVQPILFKTVIYWAVVFLARFLEKLIEYLLDGGRLGGIPEYVTTLMYPLIFTRCRTPGRRIGFGAGVLRIARRAAAAVPRACWG